MIQDSILVIFFSVVVLGKISSFTCLILLVIFQEKALIPAIIEGIRNGKGTIGLQIGFLGVFLAMFRIIYRLVVVDLLGLRLVEGRNDLRRLSFFLLGNQNGNSGFNTFWWRFFHFNNLLRLGINLFFIYFVHLSFLWKLVWWGFHFFFGIFGGDGKIDLFMKVEIDSFLNCNFYLFLNR